MLQEPNLPAQRRPRHAQTFGGAPEMQLFGHGDETGQLVDVVDHCRPPLYHAFPPSLPLSTGQQRPWIIPHIVPIGMQCVPFL
jgi:hypothetical protein